MNERYLVEITYTESFTFRKTNNFCCRKSETEGNDMTTDDRSTIEEKGRLSCCIMTQVLI